MSGMMRYYLSRAVIAAALGLFLLIGGLPWWAALLATALVLVLFLWMPRSGRYILKPEAGAAPLRRDERSRQISNRAGSIAFAVTMTAVGVLAVCYGMILQSEVPAVWLSLVATLGLLAYYAADFWMRRR